MLDFLCGFSAEICVVSDAQGSGEYVLKIAVHPRYKMGLVQDSCNTHNWMVTAACLTLAGPLYCHVSRFMCKTCVGECMCGGGISLTLSFVTKT